MFFSFPMMFLPYSKQMSFFRQQFKLSPAKAFRVDKVKILLFGQLQHLCKLMIPFFEIYQVKINCSALRIQQDCRDKKYYLLVTGSCYDQIRNQTS